MVERKLATIRTIKDIQEIPKADAIEVAVIDGWQVVVKKGEFSVGDLCVYFEIDSFLPIQPRYEFLRKSSLKRMDGTEGFRLRTIKLRGQVSQGLALSLGDFPDLKGKFIGGGDVTELLGVKKWESLAGPRVPGAGQTKGGWRGFPSWIRKTDQERIQNCYDQIMKDHSDTVFEISLKLDGSSMTVYRRNGVQGVCSRNVNIPERSRLGLVLTLRNLGEILGLSDTRMDRWELSAADFWSRVFKGRMPGLVQQQSTFWEVARKLKLLEALERSGQNVALQGELLGPGIQGNREGLVEHDFYLFDIWDIDGQKYFSPLERLMFQELHLPGVKVCPVIDDVKPSKFGSVVEILEYSDRGSINHPVAEGVVFKSHDGSVSFKAINNKFLLQEKDSDDVHT